MSRTNTPLLLAVAFVAASTASASFAQHARSANLAPRAQAAAPAAQTLRTTNGATIYAIRDASGYRASAPDGAYRLSNGGAIRVQGGRITWDAFGAVSRAGGGLSLSAEPIG